ncbi:hypothetical protein L1987_56482 [Smallanthus sonchifolius]|uniref:Uncharacterized protein n=1 Tax=Smallanthus sonchifolius TaxID=185202 RepID=A0ACB9ECS6_9ASTR|nr:hypothetical protein L1987_56482 [Smallanthus sonchifolius]
MFPRQTLRIASDDGLDALPEARKKQIEGRGEEPPRALTILHHCLSWRSWPSTWDVERRGDALDTDERVWVVCGRRRPFCEKGMSMGKELQRGDVSERGEKRLKIMSDNVIVEDVCDSCSLAL